MDAHSVTTAALLHALIDLALHRVAGRPEEAGYAQLAAGRDDLVEILPDEAPRDVGALTAPSMAMVKDGLKAALDLP
jgi:hypothetical protein